MYNKKVYDNRKKDTKRYKAYIKMQKENKRKWYWKDGGKEKAHQYYLTHLKLTLPKEE